MARAPAELHLRLPSCTRHLSMRASGLHHLVKHENVSVQFVPTAHQEADILTKGLTAYAHELARQGLRLQIVTACNACMGFPDSSGMCTLSTSCSSLSLSSEYGSEHVLRTFHWYCLNPALQAFNVFSFRMCHIAYVPGRIRDCQVHQVNLKPFQTLQAKTLQSQYDQVDYKNLDQHHNPEPYIEIRLKQGAPLLQPHSTSQASIASDVKGSDGYSSGDRPVDLQVGSYGSCLSVLRSRLVCAMEGEFVSKGLSRWVRSSFSRVAAT